MKKLKIAQIAPIWYPVPPPRYGGIERIVHFLTEGLVKLGHKVTLFASGTSKTKAKLKFWRKNHLAKDRIPWSDYFLEMEHLAFSFSQAKDFDILHCHLGPKSFFFLNFVNTPVLYTFHNPIFIERKVPLFEIAKRHKEKINAVFLTKSEREFSNFKFKKNFVVYNGVDINFFKFNPTPKDYFLWVGRVERYKGIENAIYVAKKMGIKLLLAGKIDPEKKDYFTKKIKPNLNRKIRYLGEVSQKRLVKLYQEAVGLLYPIEWEEPFGLIMAEAMACGTPVIVFDRGSAKEVVKDEKTGFVVPFLNKRREKNFKGLMKAVEKIKKIKRENCRRWVEKRFSVEKMVKNYEKIYYKLVKKF
jgi:glycosyltransferase involved in cell wall biosynthesis